MVLSDDICEFISFHFVVRSVNSTRKALDCKYMLNVLLHICKHKKTIHKLMLIIYYTSHMGSNNSVCCPALYRNRYSWGWWTVINVVGRVKSGILVQFANRTYATLKGFVMCDCTNEQLCISKLHHGLLCSFSWLGVQSLSHTQLRSLGTIGCFKDKFVCPVFSKI